LLILDSIIFFLSILIIVFSLCHTIFHTLRIWRKLGREEYDESLRSNLFQLLNLSYRKYVDSILKDYEVSCDEYKRLRNNNIIVGTILTAVSFLIQAYAVDRSGMTYPSRIYFLISVMPYLIWFIMVNITSYGFEENISKHIRTIERAFNDYSCNNFGLYSLVYDSTKNNMLYYIEFILKSIFWNVILIFIGVTWLLLSIT